jgi:hypothetical protein
MELIALAAPMLDYKLTITQKTGYLHGIVTGTNSRETVFDYLRCGLQEARTRSCTHVLIESRLEGPRLALWDIFEIAAEYRAYKGLFDAIAYVGIGAPGPLLTFIQNVSRNRGLPLRVFESVPEAEQWLAEVLAGQSCPTGAEG